MDDVPMKNEPEAPDTKLTDHPIVALLNFVGGVSGIIAIGTLLTAGGSFIQKLKDIDGRVLRLENSGSSLTREHIKEDDAREIALLQRIVVTEEAVKRFASIEGDVREIKTQIRILTDPRTTK